MNPLYDPAELLISCWKQRESKFDSVLNLKLWVTPLLHRASKARCLVVATQWRMPHSPPLLHMINQDRHSEHKTFTISELVELVVEPFKTRSQPKDFLIRSHTRTRQSSLQHERSRIQRPWEGPRGWLHPTKGVSGKWWNWQRNTNKTQARKVCAEEGSSNNTATSSGSSGPTGWQSAGWGEEVRMMCWRKIVARFDAHSEVVMWNF